MDNSQVKVAGKKAAEILEPIAGVFFTIVFLILVNVFYDNIKFITSDFKDILPLYNVSLIVGIFVQASRIFIRNKTYKAFSEVISLVFFTVIAYRLWIVYPFDTSVIGDKDLWDIIFKILIVIPPVLYMVGVVVNILKALANRK